MVSQQKRLRANGQLEHRCLHACSRLESTDRLQDLLPYLVRHQRASLKLMERENSLASSLGAENLAHGLSWPLGHRAGWWAGAFIAPASNYCRRANTLAAYADVNRYNPTRTRESLTIGQITGQTKPVDVLGCHRPYVE